MASFLLEMGSGGYFEQRTGLEKWHAGQDSESNGIGFSFFSIFQSLQLLELIVFLYALGKVCTEKTDLEAI